MWAIRNLTYLYIISCWGHNFFVHDNGYDRGPCMDSFKRKLEPEPAHNSSENPWFWVKVFPGRPIHCHNPIIIPLFPLLSHVNDYKISPNLPLYTIIIHYYMGIMITPCHSLFHYISMILPSSPIKSYMAMDQNLFFGE